MMLISKIFFPEVAKEGRQDSGIKEGQKDLVRRHSFLRTAWLLLFGSTLAICTFNMFIILEYSIQKTLLFSFFLFMAAVLNYFCYFERFFADSYVIRTTKLDPVFILGRYAVVSEKKKYKKNMMSMYAVMGGSLLFSVGSMLGVTSFANAQYLAVMMLIAVYPQLLWFCVCTSIVYMIRKETQFMALGGFNSWMAFSIGGLQFCYFAWLQRYCLERLNLPDHQHVSIRPLFFFMTQFLAIGCAAWLVSSVVLPPGKVDTNKKSILSGISQAIQNKGEVKGEKNPTEIQNPGAGEGSGSATKKDSLLAEKSPTNTRPEVMKWLLVGIAAIVVIFLLKKILKREGKEGPMRKFENRHQAKNLYRGQEREVVVRHVLDKYHHFEHVLAAKNFKRPIDISPEEFLMKINGLVRINDLDQILEVYNNAMYGNQAPDRSEFKDYKNQLNRAIGQIKRV